MVVFLVIAGAVFEFVGIWLALREVRQRRRDVQRYEGRPATGYASGARVFLNAEATATANIGGPPTLEQRVASLEQALDRIAVTARGTAEGVVRGETKGLRLYLTQDIEGVRQFMLKVTRPTYSAWTAIASLVLGLTLQTVANVIQLIAD